MPNDEGLRRCKCGQFVLIKDMVSIERPAAPKADDDESNDLPFMEHVPDELLPECISMASSGGGGHGGRGKAGLLETSQSRVPG
jgi:hypothetical protein